MPNMCKRFIWRDSELSDSLGRYQDQKLTHQFGQRRVHQCCAKTSSSDTCAEYSGQSHYPQKFGRAEILFASYPGRYLRASTNYKHLEKNRLSALWLFAVILNGWLSDAFGSRLCKNDLNVWRLAFSYLNFTRNYWKWVNTRTVYCSMPYFLFLKVLQMLNRVISPPRRCIRLSLPPSTPWYPAGLSRAWYCRPIHAGSFPFKRWQFYGMMSPVVKI